MLFKYYFNFYKLCICQAILFTYMGLMAAYSLERQAFLLFWRNDSDQDIEKRAKA